jgi:hypothetical protein
LTPLGIPVEPEVKLRVAGESGPRTTPAGTVEYCWKGSRMSAPSREPVTPDDERAMAGTSSLRERLVEMYSDTTGDKAPAEDMMRRARGVETDR